MVHGAVISALLGFAVIALLVKRSRSRCSWQEWCESAQRWEPMRECPPDKTVRIRRTGKAKKK